jgi:hypothetical protein
MNRIRLMCRTQAALLALALFTLWLGSGIFHSHPADANCQICKDLHASQAEVVHVDMALAPLPSSERVAPDEPLSRFEQRLPTPQGRSPPQA